ncbi:OLC1v1015325C1 [Oldenlandia corymbosa var. corymbosa]|uniref:OLC1v1015325C1 n=1 Tax=Oldenlandia corymbosa var. corymbosa TaxID=529605 RepID=A0AAV1E6F7_OLDCO|nr:OLC1v1015325C1 [Oldenlandia corymbosa var. corymbosa]
MQLVSHDSRTEDFSETEPILSHQSYSDAERSEESSTRSIEITVSGDVSVTLNESPNPDPDENCSLVPADQPICRICLDTGGEDLIAPCHCKGTQKYVHRSCLDNWRSTKEGFAFAHCTECRAVFILRANVPPDRWWLRLKFQFLVARDHAFIFITVQLIVAFLGVLVYKFYGEELREMFGYEEHPYGFYTMAVLAVVLVGLLYGFFIAIICGQRINERHYHVLAKQELTKEYIVEDRESNKNIPELDPSHVTELRMLGLY